MIYGKIVKILLTAGLVFVALALVGYGTFMGLYHYTSRPEFCGSCHYIQGYLTSWKQSPHKNLNCLQCHEPNGPLGKLHSKSRGLNYLLIDKGGNFSKTMIQAEFINEQRCYACHIGKNKDYPDATRMNKTGYDHFKAIKNSQKCSSCHNEVGHKTNINVEKTLSK